MEKFSPAYFEKLAADLKFSLSPEEIQGLQRDFQDVQAQMERFDAIDTEGVEPMIWPFETPTTFLREDEVSDVLTSEEALANAAQVCMNHVHVPKVVK
jgi:aspartyl-tRNA(Asn)/glutamyl-tRNA(Gln) amidotransferase subunit C